MKAQNDRLAKYLLKHRQIDQRTALNKLGIARLAARIYDLREGHWPIETETKVVKNQFGEKCRVANYLLMAPPGEPGW